MRGLILALQFLTRLPLPAVTVPDNALARAAPWFPAAGVVVGLVVAGSALLGARIDPWFAALLALIAWVWITGGLHLDGLADLADALGAAHRDREKFLAVLKDPHVGSFGIIAVALQVASKLVLLMLVIRSGQYLALVMIPAWARLGAVAWSRWLPSLTQGLGQACGGGGRGTLVLLWAVALGFAAGLVVPVLLGAPLVLLVWWCFLHQRVGGMNGDCLGAGIEVSESVLLALVLVPLV